MSVNTPHQMTNGYIVPVACASQEAQKEHPS